MILLVGACSADHPPAFDLEALEPLGEHAIPEVPGTALVRVASVSDGFFLADPPPIWLGRTFMPEDRSGGQPVALVTHALWERMGAEPEIIGRSITVDGVRRIVVGVVAADEPLESRVGVLVPR